MPRCMAVILSKQKFRHFWTPTEVNSSTALSRRKKTKPKYIPSAVDPGGGGGGGLKNTRTRCIEENA
jgi:hypothetical protein